jgi:hypothetical protein
MTRWTWVWLTAWTLASGAWCLTAAQELGATFDEPLYLEAGLKSWHSLNHKELLFAGTMPLPSEICTFPLFVCEMLQRRPIDLQGDFDHWLPIARSGTLLFWGVLLLAGFWCGLQWGGLAAGWLATAALAVEPILLGHASLATTDLAFTACLALLVATFKAGRNGTWRRRILVPAVVSGLTLLAKASGLVFIPVCLLALEGERLWNEWRSGSAISWKRSFSDLVQIGLGGLLLVFLICPRALRAFNYQIVHNVRGHGFIYLLGEISPSGFWYYFPAAFAIKVSLVLLLFLALCLLRPRHLVNGPFLAALGLLLLSPCYRVQVGVRFVLPVVALTIVGLSIAMARWQAEWKSPFTQKLAWSAVALGLLWTAIQSINVWPDGLCYTNELFGGTPRGYLALSDSNYDWGQGLPELARWQTQMGYPPLDIWYFGTDSLLAQLPIRAVDCGPSTTFEELEQNHRGRLLAVSTSFIYGGAGFGSPAVDILRRLTPVGRTTTFFIYDFSKPSSQTDTREIEAKRVNE